MPGGRWDPVGVRDAVRSAFADLPPDLLLTDEDLLASYAADECPVQQLAGDTAHDAGHHGPPALVLLPRTTEDVAAIMRAAYAHDVPVVTRGAGSGLSGAAAARTDGAVLSTRRMHEICEIDALERVAVVQPGVVTGDLRAAVAEHGLLYPPDPGSVGWSTIGGNVATDAGGMCCVKYGVTGDFVLGLEAVLADGTVVRTGRRTAKGVAGYDLTSLLVGSEGTLAVITEVTLRLVPAPGPAQTLVASFDALTDAGAAVEALTYDGMALSALEIIDRTTLRAVSARTHMDLGDPSALLIAQADDEHADDTIRRASEICAAAGGEVVVSDDQSESEALMEARRQALPALEALGDWVLDDVCVPRGAVVDLLTAVERIAETEGITIGVFGHAGDGNMHPTLIHDAADPESVAAMRRAFDAITRTALDLGGTVTGEHGIGRLKRTWLREELDGGAYAVTAALKRAMDPRNILNPGCVVPEDALDSAVDDSLDGQPHLYANPRRHHA